MKEKRNKFFANLLAAWLIKDDKWKRIRREFSLKNSVKKLGDLMRSVRKYTLYTIKYMRENRNIRQAFQKLKK